MHLGIDASESGCFHIYSCKVAEINKMIPGLKWDEQPVNKNERYYTAEIQVGLVNVRFYTKTEKAEG